MLHCTINRDNENVRERTKIMNIRSKLKQVDWVAVDETASLVLAVVVSIFPAIALLTLP